MQTATHSVNKVDDIAAFVARNYTQSLTVDDIGRAVGLHPDYAMGVFKKSFGMTLIDYLTKLRIFHAQHLLITSDSKILGISLSSGFPSISRFNAAFRAETGLTPSNYRKRYRLTGH